MIKIASVWEQKTQSGLTYFKGRLGNADILVFPNKSDHPKAPAYDVLIAKHEQYDASNRDYSVSSPPGTSETALPPELPIDGPGSPEPPF